MYHYSPSTIKRNGKRRAAALAAGLCTRCFKSKPLSDRKRCATCSQEVKEVRRRSKIKLQNEVYAAYGNKCVCCGEDQPLFLTLDHINDDGYKHRQKSGLTKSGNKIGINLNRWARQNHFPNTLRLMCSNCNMGRWRNGGICPHKA